MQFKRIRELRLEQHLTLLQIGRSTYSGYERGTSDIPLEVICDIADIHRTSLDYLTGFTDQRTLFGTEK